MTSKVTICLSIPPVTLGPSPSLHPKQMSIWRLAREAICRGESVCIQQGSCSSMVTNRAFCPVDKTLCVGFCVASQNQSSNEDFVVQMSLGAFVIFRGWYPETSFALQMMLKQAPRLLHPFVAQRLPKSSIQLFWASYLFHRSSRPCPPILALSIH